MQVLSNCWANFNRIKHGWFMVGLDLKILTENCNKNCNKKHQTVDYYKRNEQTRQMKANTHQYDWL